MKAEYRYINSGIMFTKIKVEHNITKLEIEVCIYSLILNNEKIIKNRIEYILKTYIKQEGDLFIDHNPTLLNYQYNDEILNTVLSYSKKLYPSFY